MICTCCHSPCADCTEYRTPPEAVYCYGDAAITGGGLSTAMHACRPKARHDSLALYILLRGITLLVRCGNKPDAPPAVRKLLTITRLKHGDTALMCACTSQACPHSWNIF